MTIDMKQFAQMFFEEAEELLAQIECHLLELDLAQPSAEALNAIFRAAHSIKGGSATFGLQDITDLTHVLEGLLDRARNREVALTAESVDALLAAKDVVRMLIAGYRDGAAEDTAQLSEVRARLQALANRSITTADPQEGEANASLDAAERHSSDQSVLDDRLELLELAIRRVGDHDAQTLISEMSMLGTLTHQARRGDELELHLLTNVAADDVRGLCAFVVSLEDVTITRAGGSTQPQTAPPDLPEPSTVKPQPVVGEHAHGASAAALRNTSSGTRRAESAGAAGVDSGSIRVSVERVDQLINLVGELVITQAMLEQLCGAADAVDPERLRSGVSQLTRNTRDLQEAVMSIRMMQMDTVFSRFPRMVRDLATKLGKKVEFVTYGGATELDKGLIEKIIDPLTHLVRNSVDHGIETPDVRLAAGKPEQGRLTLSAAHQGGKIVVRVKDDGKGLAREKIISKARERGLSVPPDASDQEVFQLIFAPGFSTAETVTDVSGRGVGMDVVKRNITSLGGTVEIQSAPGAGTTVSIAVPLTLAILDGMSVQVGKELFIIPLGYIVESLQPRIEDVRSVRNEGTVVQVRGEYLPVVTLHEVFGLRRDLGGPDRGILVILEADGVKTALFVDALVGQHQVVIKSLESNYRKVAGVSGATIMGDGRVALILDVAHIVGARQRRLDKAA